MTLPREAVLALVPVLIAVGCGSDAVKNGSNGAESKSPEQVLEESTKALSAVKSFHVEATERSPSSVKADVGLPSELRLAIQDRAASATLLVVQGSFYARGNSAYWKDVGARREAEALADRWFKVPYSLARNLTKLVNAKTISRCLVKHHGTLARGGTATVNGQRAVVIIDKGDRPGTAPSKLYVAATGAPLPLRMLATGRDHPGGHKDPECGGDTPTHAGDDTVFSRYNEPLRVSPPPAAESFDSGQAS